MSAVQRRITGSSREDPLKPKTTTRNITKTGNIGENTDDQKPSSRQNISLRVLSRIVIITSLLVIVYFSSEKEKVYNFAKQSETLGAKGHWMECSSDYTKEIFDYTECIPKKCGRFVSDSVVSNKEAETLLSIARRGLALGGSSGGASILDLHSGALSSDEKFVNIYKIEKAKNIFTENDFRIYRVVKDKIKYAIAHYFEISPKKIYLTHPTFFSRMTTRPAKTVHDEYWHPHVDKETYKSFHYTSLLYLSEYNQEFQGGRFIFIDKNSNSTVEPRKARVSLFTSGSENVHFVEKVTSGVRYAVTIAFTCNQNYAINDPDINKFES